MTLHLLLDGHPVPFEMDDFELICLPSHKYRDVELCLKERDGHVNVCVAEIRLYNRDRWVDKEATYEDAVAFGKEVVRRWRDCAAAEVERDARIAELEAAVAAAEEHGARAFADWCDNDAPCGGMEWTDEEGDHPIDLEELIDRWLADRAAKEG